MAKPLFGALQPTKHDQKISLFHHSCEQSHSVLEDIGSFCREFHWKHSKCNLSKSHSPYSECCRTLGTTKRRKAEVVAAREAVTATAVAAATTRATVRARAATQGARPRARTKRSAPYMNVF